MHRFYFVHVFLLFPFAKTWPIPILTFRFPTYNLILPTTHYFKNILLVNLRLRESNNENKLFSYPVYASNTDKRIFHIRHCVIIISNDNI